MTAENQLIATHGRRGRLVVIDGDPGSGKTSAIASVAQAFGARVVPELDHLTSGIGLGEREPEGLEQWYLTTARERQTEILEWLDSGSLVLQDRCPLSTYAFTFASAAYSGKPLDLQWLLRRIHAELECIVPDGLVLMEVAVSVSIARRHHWRTSEQHRLWFDPEFLAHFHEFYSTLGPRVLNCRTMMIDTSELSLADTVDALAAFVRSLVPEGGS